MEVSTKCLMCETIKTRAETFHDISVPVQNMHRERFGYSILEALSRTGAPERLSGNDKYYCEECCTRSEAERSQKIGTLPEVLTVHLNRFMFLEVQIKINTMVQCPEYLNMGRWSTPGVEGSTHYGKRRS